MRYAVAHHTDEGLDDFVPTDVHTYAMRLHHSRLAVAVDHQSRQVVALTMYQAVGVVLRIVGDADADAHVERNLQPAFPESIINWHVAKRKHPDRDAPYLVVADGKELALGIIDSDDVALADSFVHALDGS